MFEPEEPSERVREFALPWAANWFVWSLTISSVVAARAAKNPALWFGPTPLSERSDLAQIVDGRTVWLPVTAALAAYVIAWAVAHGRAEKAKGRNTPKRFASQVLTEVEALLLGGGSLAMNVAYYASNLTLAVWAAVAWAGWVGLKVARRRWNQDVVSARAF